MKVSMVVTEEEEALQKSLFEVTWTDEESGVAKKAKKVRVRCILRIRLGRDAEENANSKSLGICTYTATFKH